MRFKILLSLLTASLYAVPGYYEPWGKDASLKYPSPEIESPPLSSLGIVMHQVIQFHQNVLSPVDGPRSHFKPSSSNYMLQAIRKYGFFQGYIMGCDRLLRENSDPWVYRTALINGKIWKVNEP